MANFRSSFVAFVLFVCMILTRSFGQNNLGAEAYMENSSQKKVDLTERQKQMFDNFVKRLGEFPSSGEADGVQELPQWMYSLPGEPDLKNLNKEHNLKRIAGKGGKIETFLNLKDWVHTRLSVDGEVGKPERLDTPSIFNYVDISHHAVNCRMKSIVLNEALLALGYRSRRISFIPSIADSDTHSMVTVFSQTLQKWICLDPTFNTHFYDASGNIMGFLEIREAYKKGEIPNFRSIQIPIEGPLVLHGERFDSYDAWYAVYIAKNCFQAMCPLKSELGYESSETPAWICLIPLKFKPETATKVKTYFTSDQGYFFHKPYFINH
jgi:hypothetical protein